MTKQEYDELQARMSRKLELRSAYRTNKEMAYNEGVLACKSILKEIFMRETEEAPTINAEPVRHGRWMHAINNLYSCSKCLGRETMSPKHLKPYCPNCGAKMDLEGMTS